MNSEPQFIHRKTISLEFSVISNLSPKNKHVYLIIFILGLALRGEIDLLTNKKIDD